MNVLNKIVFNFKMNLLVTNGVKNFKGAVHCFSNFRIVFYLSLK